MSTEEPECVGVVSVLGGGAEDLGLDERKYDLMGGGLHEVCMCVCGGFGGGGYLDMLES